MRPKSLFASWSYSLYPSFGLCDIIRYTVSQIQTILKRRRIPLAKKPQTEVALHSSAAEYLTYVAATGSQESSVEMRYEDENIWLTQKMMATLYDVTVPAISQHIKKIFDDQELLESAVIKKYLITANDGKSYSTKHYCHVLLSIVFQVYLFSGFQFFKCYG